jgi:nucleoside-diphosphate-sugar epimerase
MTESELEDLLSQPTPLVIDTMARVEGDILILGAGGKMGPSLARLAIRASHEAGRARRVIAAARFSEPGLATRLAQSGVETIQCDLFDSTQVARLPDVQNIIYMAGQKFGTTGDGDRTWAVNAYLPGVVATRFPAARIVAFSTGNVYPLWPADSAGPTESDPTGPIGEYAQSALARERVFEHFSRRNGTLTSLLRLNYAVEPRYGVVRDIAERVRARAPVDLSMAKVNLIWQRDANAIALAALSHASDPPLVLNVTGPAVPVRWIAEECGRHLNVAPEFSGAESGTALLSNPAESVRRFGPPPVDAGEMIARVVTWMAQGGRSLNKPTHFETRDGAF